MGARRDPFGYEPRFHRQMLPVLEFFYRRYWRVRADGVANVPARGPVLVVGNHSGGIPIDAAMVGAAIEFDHPRARVLRILYDRFVAGMPVIPEAYNRFGAVVASYANAEKLLRRRQAVGVFPEGVAGVAKGFASRYQLQRFHTGFIRLSLTLRVPIVPVAVVGAEEAYPVIGKWKPTGALKGLFNVPYIPVTPFFPLLGVIGMIPLPTKWYIRFAEPLHLYRECDGHAADRHTVTALSEQVRRQIQSMVHDLLAERESLF